jgi:hypothetical protein
MHMTERIYGFWLPLWYLQTLLKDMLDCAQKISTPFGSNNVQILQALRWRFDVWEAIVAVKNDGMSARNSYIT